MIHVGQQPHHILPRIELYPRTILHWTIPSIVELFD